MQLEHTGNDTLTANPFIPSCVRMVSISVFFFLADFHVSTRLMLIPFTLLSQITQFAAIAHHPTKREY